MTKRILVSCEGEKTGPYSLDEVVSQFNEGRFRSTDLAWIEGASTWIPLSSIAEIGQDFAISDLVGQPVATSIPPADPPANRTEPAEGAVEEIPRSTRIKAYAAMSGAIESNLAQFLTKIERATHGIGPVNSAGKEEFFRNFLIRADKFTGCCCQEFANILRLASILPEVRGTDLQALAHRLRETAFAELDSMLLRCIVILKEINVDLAQTLAQLQESSLRQAALDPGQSSNSPKAKTGGTAIKLELLNQQNELISQAQSLAFSKMVDYLRDLGALPAALLDYAATKCFGGDVDFALQKKVLNQIEIALEPKLTHAIELLLNFASAERMKRERQQSSEAARTHGSDEQRARSESSEAQGIICLAISLVCLFPAWLAVMSSAAGQGIKAFTIVAGVIGFSCFFLGIVRLTSNRAGRLRGDAETQKQPKDKTEDSPPPSLPSEAERSSY
jgi:hypothetical protein